MTETAVGAFQARVRQAGVPLGEAEAAQILPAWDKLVTWLDLLRQPALGAEAEPATTFSAGKAP